MYYLIIYGISKSKKEEIQYSELSYYTSNLNETNHYIYSSNRNIPIKVWFQSDEVKAIFDECLILDSPYSEEIIKLSVWDLCSQAKKANINC